jgi:N-acetylglucosaminyldiphosphoundecaprenol N-acetyl-beta-D-mannosaminyltransferase
MPIILGIPLFDADIKNFISQLIIAMREPNSNKCLSATGAHGLVYAQRHLEFADILRSFYMNLPDGMSTVWIGRLKGAKRMRRCYGPEFFKEVIIESKDKNIRHFFCGGKAGVAEDLKNVCENKFNNYNIVGTFSPPFRAMTDEELADLANRINEVKTDIVWIGLSTPKQEILASRLSKYTNVHFLCAVGAAFDFHTGRIKQAPQWIQLIGMEWFFRLLVEPKRLWRRYLEIVPLFIWFNCIELLKGDFFIDQRNNDNVK